MITINVLLKTLQRNLNKLFMVCRRRHNRNLKCIKALENETVDGELVNNIENTTKERSNSLKNYLKSINALDLFNQIPQNFVKRKKFLTHLSLIDRETASKFAHLIQNCIKDKNKIVLFELNPGFGLLTKELLNHGIHFINICEDRSPFLIEEGPLDTLLKIYPSNLQLHHKQYYQVMALNYDEICQMFINHSQPVLNQKEKPTLILVATVSNMTYITNILRNIIDNNFIIQYGKTKIYLAMLPSIWIKLKATKDVPTLYRWRTILFQLIFNFKELGTLNRQSFLPWVNYRINFKQIVYNELRILDKQFMNVVEITLRPDFCKNSFDKNELLMLWYFVRSNAASKKMRIIPELEKWAPGCGVNLIYLGYNIFTEFGELSPDEFLSIFKVFISSSNFDKDVYLSQMENFQIRDIENEEPHESTTEL